MKTVGLAIEPCDVLFFRGGRPFGAGLVGDSELPTPQVLLGAIRTLLLRSVGANLSAMREAESLEQAFAAAGAPDVAQVAIRGPWLAKKKEADLEPLFRAPADLRMQGEKESPQQPQSKQLHRLRPKKAVLPGWQPLRPEMSPLLMADAGRPPVGRPAFISLSGMRAWAEGKTPADTEISSPEQLFVKEERTGIEVDADTRSSKEGLIYTVRMLRLLAGLCFYAEISIPESLYPHLEKARLIPFGGEGRLARISICPRIAWPQPPTNGKSCVVTLLTPGFFEDGWLPAALRSAPILGAAVDSAVCLSGWDLAKGGPKPARFGVPEGSVYFLGSCELPDRTYAENKDDRLAGYGLYLKGIYHAE